MPLKSYADVIWTDEIDQQIRSASDAQVARINGIGYRSVRSRRERLGIHPNHRPTPAQDYHWTKSALKRLGTIFDKQLARELGTTGYVVRKQRLELGIKPYRRPPLIPGEPSNGPPFQWTHQREAKLGQVPDPVLARRWGIHPTIVRTESSSASRLIVTLDQWNGQRKCSVCSVRFQTGGLRGNTRSVISQSN